MSLLTRLEDASGPANVLVLDSFGIDCGSRRVDIMICCEDVDEAGCHAAFHITLGCAQHISTEIFFSKYFVQDGQGTALRSAQ